MKRKRKIIHLFLLIPFFLMALEARAETVTVNAVADSFTDSSRPNDNFGMDPTLHIHSRVDGHEQYFLAGYVRFNINSFVPLDSSVRKATLKLYLNDRTCDRFSISAYRVEGNWSENSITRANAPDSGWDMGHFTIPAMGYSGYIPADVTHIVRNWVDNRYLNYGFSFSNMSYADCWASFSSRQGAHKPQLEIVYDPPADETPPRITDIAERITANSASISWKTINDPSIGSVMYKRTGINIWSLEQKTGERLVNHFVVLSGLTPATRYEYRVKSKDVSGNEALSEIRYFQTADASVSSSNSSSNSGSESGQILEVYNVIKDVLGPTSARIKWWSNLPGTSWVLVSEIADDSTPNAEYTPYGRNDEVDVHEIEVAGLFPGTTYNYKVLTRTVDNQVAISERKTFTTYEQAEAVSSEAGNSEENVSGDENGANGESRSNLEEDPEILAEILREANAADVSPASGDDSVEIKNGQSKNAPAIPFILFFLMRMMFPLFIIFFIIAIIVFVIWKKSRKKNLPDRSTAGATANTTTAETGSQVVAQAVPTKKKSKAFFWIIAIIMIIFILIILKNLLTFFVPLPF